MLRRDILQCIPTSTLKAWNSCKKVFPTDGSYNPKEVTSTGFHEVPKSNIYIINNLY